MTEFVWALFSGIKTKVKYRILRAFFMRVGIFATHQTSGNKYGCETISLGLEKKKLTLDILCIVRPSANH